MFVRLLGAAVAALCLLLATAAQVNADDGWNRTGFYAGVVGGYDLVEAKAEDFKMSEGSLFAGPFGGFNYRVNPGLIVGVELDYMFMNVKADKSESGFTVTASSNYLASVRGRVGLPIGPALLYATGGLAVTEHEITATSGPLSIGDSKFVFGGVVGGGVEAELTKTVFARIEALHYWFPETGMAIGPMAFESGQHQTVVRAGLGFKLN